MIKAAGKTAAGRPLLLLGLSGENVTRLTAGEPIHISAAGMAQLGLPEFEVIIHYGRTEQAIIEELRDGGLSLSYLSEGGRLAGFEPREAGGAERTAPPAD